MPSSRLTCAAGDFAIAATSGSSALASTARRAVKRATSGMRLVDTCPSATAGPSATSGSMASQIIVGRL